MAWHQLCVTTTEKFAPKLARYFTHLGAISVTYMDAADDPVYEPRIGETKIWANTQVIALYELACEPLLIENTIKQRFKHQSLENWVYEYIDDQAWERAWMDYYQPMKFANRLWVCPSGQAQYEENTVCLTLDPGLAFGTGTHPTTAMCLEWLASHDLVGKTVIDYGCGSGILAIASVLLGAKMAYAVDIDPQAITATQDNAAKNHVAHKIECYLVENFVGIQANIVMANILAKPLIDLNDQINSLLVQNGALVLSGILAEQLDSVAQAYSHSVQFISTQQEDWVLLAGIKH
jgi:ribosomal protein L11 methyltransferase